MKIDPNPYCKKPINIIKYDFDKRTKLQKAVDAVKNSYKENKNFYILLGLTFIPAVSLSGGFINSFFIGCAIAYLGITLDSFEKAIEKILKK